LTPNCGIETTHSDRRGREVKIPPFKGIRVQIQTLREASFQVHGPRLFNSLPKSVRSTTNVTEEEFKSSLDKFLEKLPDEPKVGNYVPSACNIQTASPSKSIIDLAKTMRARRPG
jgi:hypothetical protein